MIDTVIHGSKRPPLKQVGFWADKRKEATPELPWPGDMVDPKWSKKERKMVISYLRSQPTEHYYKGWSWCRICDKDRLGDSDQSDGVYLWPSGYVHYLEKHKVKPPQDFIDHVKRMLRKKALDHVKKKKPLAFLAEIAAKDFKEIKRKLRVARKHREGGELSSVTILTSKERRVLTTIIYSIAQGKFPHIKESQIKIVQDLADLLGLATRIKIRWSV